VRSQSPVGCRKKNDFPVTCFERQTVAGRDSGTRANLCKWPRGHRGSVAEGKSGLGFIKGFVKFVSWAVVVLAIAWTLLIILTAKVLGNAVLVNETDAYVALALNVLAVPAVIVLIVAAGRNKRRLKKQPIAAPWGPPMHPGHYPGYGPTTMQ